MGVANAFTIALGNANVSLAVYQELIRAGQGLVENFACVLLNEAYFLKAVEQCVERDELRYTSLDTLILALEKANNPDDIKRLKKTESRSKNFKLEVLHSAFQG